MMVLMMQTHAQTHSPSCFADVNLAYEHLMRMQAKQANTWININTASVAQLTQLTGVGVKTAEQIVLYRQTMGRFNSIDDLLAVKGIGIKTLEKNRHRLVVHD